MRRILPYPRINPSRWSIVGSDHHGEQDVDGAAAITALNTGDRVPVTWKGSKTRVRSGSVVGADVAPRTTDTTQD